MSEYDSRGLPMNGAEGYNPDPPAPTSDITPAMTDQEASQDGVWKQATVPGQEYFDTDSDEKEPS